MKKLDIAGIAMYAVLAGAVLGLVGILLFTIVKSLIFGV